jgi:hypothetical protein
MAPILRAQLYEEFGIEGIYDPRARVVAIGRISGGGYVSEGDLNPAVLLRRPRLCTWKPADWGSYVPLVTADAHRVALVDRAGRVPRHGVRPTARRGDRLARMRQRGWTQSSGSPAP